ncbi:hypothetical protein JG688_00008323 [Phytophthora aleatoria]|uniref:Uncharacterized protein n=1 Tax=Phytophthora aleatoria TaxID=2496075 RepID=A0A8J5MFQ6_9STRA|nr:hypothetical protein JG688_00008323 [Phytophthora aleatoria]
MDPFQISSANFSILAKSPNQQPPNALMVVDNRQLQVWRGLNCWPPNLENPQHHGTAATMMELTADSGELIGEESPSSSASASPSPEPQEPEKKKKRVFKKRKATHTIRKEQKAALEKEINELQIKLEDIKFRALVQEGDVSKSFHDRAVENAVLRESIQDQHLVMAQVRALLSGQMHHQMSGVRPMETKICLSADREERRRVLHALRGAKLREAKRFLCARSSGIKPNTPYFQEERYESADGGYCIARFEITPLHGVKGGVRAVFDAVLQAAFNAEIIISETSGNITVREDDDMNDESVSQMRLVSQTNRDVLVENNLVHFTEYSHGESDTNGNECYAITATDFVDEDELYPYRPLERVRRDTTAAMLVSYVDSPKKSDKKAESEGEPVIILMRWACTKICHTDLNISCEAMQDIRETRIVDLIHAVESDMMISSKTNITTRKLEPQHQSGVSDSAQEPVEKQRVYKKRKPTHTVRKEEKVALQAEIAALQTKLKNLELQVLVQRGVKGGIRAVLDALKYAAFNAEIIISETSGDLTIREDDDVTEEECSQLRLKEVML